MVVWFSFWVTSLVDASNSKLSGTRKHAFAMSDCQDKVKGHDFSQTTKYTINIIMIIKKSENDACLKRWYRLNLD